MIDKCPICERWYEDEYRSKLCPHKAFPANDGNNKFGIHEDAYLADEAPLGLEDKPC